ncbi:Alpha/Beta hydrolase protein [Irpex rosettiformis]|uniref:Alpha/Beta hydrolase protein n=1 Tax=Irpex rosettiformis TaxID=378272 RepID=A0ACB8TPL2_9APHY|nr:Alpha/Beta hydrolase protein [Irpex rosettiformis]
MYHLPLLTGALVVSLLITTAYSQGSRSVPNSFPHDYPGKPRGDFSPEWQDYYLVKNGSLPNVTFPLNRNWAGSITVNRTKHPNDTLFFWAFEHTNGSLTSPNSTDDPWAIWLNGGPGASSLLGLLLENGPLLVAANGSMVPNNQSWANLVDYVWVDQPVGTGFSTAESNGGYILNEDQMGSDFLNFLRNLVKIFPSLATRPLLLTGESYAGTYIPYITKTIFSTPNPPVNLTKIAIGNGAMGAEPEYEVIPALSLIETYPQLIGYDAEVYQYFKTQNHLCGYDFNLTYPQQGKFPPVHEPLRPTEGFRAAALINQPSALLKKRFRALVHAVEAPEVGIVKRDSIPTHAEMEARDHRRRAWLARKNEQLHRRDLRGRANGTIDPWYGCFLTSELQDYALNFSMPWNLSREIVVPSLDDYGPYNVYNLEDARAPPLAIDPSVFMNNQQTRAALHAPTSKNWTLQINYPFNSSFLRINGSNPFGDPSVEPVAFFDDLAANATEHGVQVIIYLGNDDTVVPHFSSEITIQNTTFGGTQGFSRKPSTAWQDDDGSFAGVIHQERNWTYILVAKAGHEVPEYQPQAGFVMFREFILGNNATGRLVNNSNIAIGGENLSLLLGPNNILPGETSILFGSGASTRFYAAPSATVASWNDYFAKVISEESPTATATVTGTGSHQSSSGLSVFGEGRGLSVVGSLIAAMWLAA